MLVELDALLVVTLEMLDCELRVQSMDEELPKLLLDVIELEVTMTTLLTNVEFTGS